MSDPLLAVEDLTITYETDQGAIHAVSDASFTIDEGEYFGLVGESGCGKSTVANAIVGGLDANASIESGSIRFKGKEIQDFTEQEFNREIRWKEISLIPQTTMSSLDPIVKLSKQAVQVARVHTDWSKQEALDQFREKFEIVGLSASRIHDYPFQFSGGMKQRAAIAFALLLDPSLIIADEPTTALDVIMQDQIMKHMNMLREDGSLSVLFITHDISLIFENCDTVTVMHASQVAETGDITEVYDHPRHPYTYLLKQAFPDVRHPERHLETIDGTPPQLREQVDYCTFVDRCPYAIEECAHAVPPLEAAEDDAGLNHEAACFRKDELEELTEEKVLPS